MEFHVGTDTALIDPRNVHSLTDFQRNAKDHLRRMKKTRQPALFTVNGRGAVVMLDSATFVKLMRRLDELEEEAAIQHGLDDLAAGKGKPFEEFITEFRAKHAGGSRRRRSA